MKSNFKKSIIINVAVIVASVILIVGALIYFSGDINFKSAEVVKNRSSQEQAAAELAHLADLERNQAVAAGYQAAVGRLIPKRSQLINFPPAVSSLATADNVTANVTFNNDATPPASAGSAGNVSFTINAQGSFGDVVRFVNDLETKLSGFLMNIASLQVSNNGTGGAQLNLKGVVYFQ
ncbi:MAG TPA: hypothetical protein VMT99_01730 [Candidatus Paceibacterota bacterium]|nr:hypothetical protein [Candidatus Paceibacterota bacterium]